MIKYLKYMFIAAITMIAVASCQEDIEESFAKKTTPPELNNNGTILMTQNTCPKILCGRGKLLVF